MRSKTAQDEIDALGGGKTIRETRFELAYKKCRGENVTLAGGVAPTALQVGCFTFRKYGQYPKDL